MVRRLESLCRVLGCPRNRLVNALLEGVLSIAEIEELEESREACRDRLPTLGDSGTTHAIAFEPGRLVLRLRRGRGEYRIVRSLF
jgi:hypothetical protein